MMQGDSYGLTIDVLNADDEAVTPDDVSDVEVTIGNLRKTYASGDHDYEVWTRWGVSPELFCAGKEETFKFPAARVKAQVRVVWANGDVEGTVLDPINVRESMSKEVL